MGRRHSDFPAAVGGYEAGSFFFADRSTGVRPPEPVGHGLIVIGDEVPKL